MDKKVKQVDKGTHVGRHHETKKDGRHRGPERENGHHEGNDTGHVDP